MVCNYIIAQKYRLNIMTSLRTHHNCIFPPLQHKIMEIFPRQFVSGIEIYGPFVSGAIF